MRHAGLFTLGAAAFALLVILNAGGYRYGVSDQAFYLPAVLQQMVPDLYPHDAPLIAARDRLLLFDDWFAPLLERTNVSPPVGFLAAYAVTLSLLYFAIVGIGRVLYSSWWTIGGLAVCLTMRHQIPDTAVNTLEGYFQPAPSGILHWTVRPVGMPPRPVVDCAGRRGARRAGTSDHRSLVWGLDRSRGHLL